MDRQTVGQLGPARPAIWMQGTGCLETNFSPGICPPPPTSPGLNLEKFLLEVSILKGVAVELVGKLNVHACASLPPSVFSSEPSSSDNFCDSDRV